jgi:hypothetical protein
MRTMNIRVVPALAAAPGPGPETGRIALIAIMVAAVAAFAVLQAMARSRGGRPEAGMREDGPRDWPS